MLFVVPNDTHLLYTKILVRVLLAPQEYSLSLKLFCSYENHFVREIISLSSFFLFFCIPERSVLCYDRDI